MASDAPFDLHWQLVAGFSLILLVMILLLLLRIVDLRARLFERGVREQRFLEIWQPLLAAAVAGDREELPPLAKDDAVFFMQHWCHLQESLRGPATRRLNIIALRCDILQHAYDMLQRGDLRLRLLALIVLGYLRDPQGRQDILTLTRHRDPVLSLMAARTLFRVDADTALRDLMQPLLEREDWPRVQLAAMLKEAGAESIFVELARMAASQAYGTDPVGMKKLHRMLYLLEVAPTQLVLPAVRSILLSAMDGEIIAHCLKFLGASLGDPGDLPLVRRYLEHPAWVVRMRAASALGRIGEADDLPRLQALLGDSVWWVRYRAAQALLVLLRGDVRALSGLREHLGPGEALAMLEMASAEREGQ